MRQSKCGIERDRLRIELIGGDPIFRRGIDTSFAFASFRDKVRMRQSCWSALFQ